MQLARVVGTVVCTHKDARLSGVTLLVIQPLSHATAPPFGRTLVATDAVGAGVGEDVFFVRGAEASFPFHPRRRAHRRRASSASSTGRRLTGVAAECRSARVVGTVGRHQEAPPSCTARSCCSCSRRRPTARRAAPALLAIDSVGAGVGERVLLVIEGKAAGDALGRKAAPVDAAIIGIIDRVDDTSRRRRAGGGRMTEDELRALVRDAVARHLAASGGDAGSSPAVP